MMEPVTTTGMALPVELDAADDRAPAFRPGERTVLATLGDVVRLAKPRLSALVLFTTASGLWLAPGHITAARGVLTLVMTMLVVASANTFNCYIERESDGRMKRTRLRPLPQHRIDPGFALVVAIIESAIALPALAWGVGSLVGVLAAIAVVSYAGIYTPMKFRSASAVIVGAVPGAIPPLLGWVAVTGHIQAGGLALFALMFLWQLPHFLAIALYLRDDYRRAGIRVLPLTQGDRVTHVWIALTTAMLVPSTLVLTPLHVAGRVYFVVALLAGIALFFWSLTGLELPKNTSSAQWGRRLFLGTIGYLTLIFVVLGLDAT
jgi:protoheme IX farnesyltransferase